MNIKYGIFYSNGPDNREHGPNGISLTSLEKFRVQDYDSYEAAIEGINNSEYLPTGLNYLIIPFVEHQKV